MSRRSAYALGLAFAITMAALAFLQIGSMALFGSAAQPASLPAQLPAALGVRIYEAIERVAPARALRLSLASAALREGRLEEAQRRIAELAPSADREELRARLFLARGRRADAIAAFLAAGDAAALAREVGALDAAGDYRGARRFEEQVVARLRGETTHPDAQAEAWWNLGQLDAESGYRIVSQRPTFMRAAMHAYERALALAPLSEKYLLAAGNQAMFNRQPAVARNYFERALDVDPASAAAFVGLGELAFEAGDLTLARSYLRRAKAIDAALPSVRRLAAKLAP